MRRKRKLKLLDEVDRKIINVLRQDCLTPFVKIAKSLNVNEGTIRHRVKKLTKHGIIKAFTVATDPAVLGLGAVAFVVVTVSPGHVQQVAQELARIPYILEIHEVHTYGDLLLKVRAPSFGDIARILSDDIKSVEGVINSQVISVLNVWKDELVSLIR
ncbi:MAG: Lrp/AsnC family transcriptional regulator [Nitrososphaerales archaeon]